MPKGKKNPFKLNTCGEVMLSLQTCTLPLILQKKVKTERVESYGVLMRDEEANDCCARIIGSP